jgi:DNA polymerase/3'-5' exonuclease PolX
VQKLYESGEIDRISNLVNTAVRLYLRKFYGYGKKEQPEIPRKTTTLRAACSLSRILKGQ